MVNEFAGFGQRGTSPATEGTAASDEFAGFGQPKATSFGAPAPVEEDDDGGLFGGAFGFGADAFRAVVPKSVRDVAGAAIQNTISGERFINTITPGEKGTDIMNRLREIDHIGGLLATGFDVATAPATVLTAGFGGQAAAGLGQLGRAGKIAAAVVEPVTGATAASASGRFAQRFAAENVLGIGAEATAGAVAERLPEGADPVIAGGLALAAGAFGGVTALRTVGRVAPGAVGAKIAISAEADVSVEALLDNTRDLHLSDIVQAKSADDLLETVGWKDAALRKIRQANKAENPGFGARLMSKIMPGDPDAQLLFSEANVREQAHDSWLASRMVRVQANIAPFTPVHDVKTGNVTLPVKNGEIVLTPEMQASIDDWKTILDESSTWAKENGVDTGATLGIRNDYSPLTGTEVTLPFAAMFERVTGGHYFPRQITEIDGYKNVRGQMDPFVISQRAPGFAEDVPEVIAEIELRSAAGTKYEGDIAVAFESRMKAEGRRVNAQWFRDTASSERFGARTAGKYVDHHRPGLRTSINQRKRTLEAQKLQLEKKISRAAQAKSAASRARKSQLRNRQATKRITQVEAQELRVLELVDEMRSKTIQRTVTDKQYQAAKSDTNRATTKILKDTETGMSRLNETRDIVGQVDTLMDEVIEAQLLSEAEVARVRRNMSDTRIKLERDKDILTELRAKGSLAQPGEVRVQSLGGTFLPEGMGRAVNEGLGQQGKHGVVEKLGSFNNFSRALMATMDLSAAGIQGLLALGAHPIQAANALRIAWGSLHDPEMYSNFLRTERKVVDSFLEGGGHLALDDSGEFAFGGAIKRIPVVGKAVEWSNLAFTRTGNMMRVTLYKQALETNRFTTGSLGSKGAIAKGVTDSQRREIIKTINSATGYHGSKPSSWESIALFAPRYFRSQLDVMGKATLKGGPDGDYARMLMFRTMMMGTALTVIANEARGHSTDFNPIREDSKGNMAYNSNFMRIRDVGGKDVSMFGGWDSLLGLMTTTAVAGPSEGVSRLLRTKASPAASTVFDIIDGETFDGTPVDIMSLEGLGSAIITESLNKLPFTAQDTLEALGNGEMPTGAAFNFFGVKSAPVTLTEQRDMIAQETFDAHWSDLTGKEQDTIKASHAELFRDLDEDTKERAANGDVEAQARLERKKVDDDRIAEEAALGAAVQSGRLSVNDFTDRMNVLQASSADQKQRIDSLLGLSYGESDNPNVRALGEWYDLRDTAMIEGTNILDFELWEEIEASYMAGLTPEQTRFIEDRSRPEHAPEVDWYYQSKDIVSGSGYYDTIDAAFDMLSPALSNIKPPVANYSDLLRRIQTAKQSGDIANLNQLEAIKDAMGRTAGAQKRLLRVGNPALDQALLQLGRVSTPITSQR